MAGKGRKVAAQHVEEDTEEKSEASVDMQAMMRLILAGNAKAEASRIEEAKRAATEKLAEEERAEARRIAAEERAEARKRADKIAEEERAELRRVAAEEKAEEKAEAKIQRKLEAEEKVEAKRVAEARAAEELELAREESARVASERMLEQQEAANKRAYDQQVALIKLQAEIGEKAANAQRLEQAVGKKRDRAVASIPNHKDSEDIEDFLMTSERKLREGEIPEEEWLTILSAKLSGKIGSSWQDLCVISDDYHEVKANLLKVCGYTPKIAGEVYYGFKAEHTRGMSADQLYHRGVQLVRRMVAPLKLSEALEFAILKPWVSAAVSKKARMVLDSRAVSTPVELIDALQDHLVMEGDRTEGQAAVFRRQAHGGEVSSERKVSGAALR